MSNRKKALAPQALDTVLERGALEHPDKVLSKGVVLDTEPEPTFGISATVYHIEEPENDRYIKFREWEATAEFHGPHSGFSLTVRRVTCSNDKAGSQEQTVKLNICSPEEAQFIGDLILASVEKLRRTSDRHKIPMWNVMPKPDKQL